MQTQFLRRWWCKKYQLPPTDERFLAYTTEDLVIEMYEDLYEKKPDLIIPDGDDDQPEDDVDVEESGDPLMDEFNRRLAKGESVDDLWELLEPKDEKKSKKTGGSRK